MRKFSTLITLNKRNKPKTNAKASSTSSVKETKGQKTHAYFIALTVGGKRANKNIKPALRPSLMVEASC